MKNTNPTVGTFPDVTFRQGLLYISYAWGGFFHVDVFNPFTGAFLPFYKTPTADVGNGYGRVRNVNDVVWAIYTNASGTQQILTDIAVNRSYEFGGRYELMGGALGQNGFGCNDSNSVYRTRSYETQEEILQIPQLSVQGISYIQDDNYPVSVDDNRSTYAQYGILNGQRFGKMVTGEGQDDGGVPVLDYDTKKRINLDPLAFRAVPKITGYKSDGNDRWAIVSGDYHNVFLYYDISSEDVNGEAPPIPQPGDIELHVTGPIDKGRKIIIHVD